MPPATLLTSITMDSDPSNVKSLMPVKVIEPLVLPAVITIDVPLAE